MNAESYLMALDDSDYLEHHGVKGMKWGVRRYQNKDGSYTSAGLQRYSKNAKSGYDKASSTGSKRAAYKVVKNTNKLEKKAGKYAKKAEKTKNAEKAEAYSGMSKAYAAKAKKGQEYINKLGGDQLVSDYQRHQRNKKIAIAAGTAAVAAIGGITAAKLLTGGAGPSIASITRQAKNALAVAGGTAGLSNIQQGPSMWYSNTNANGYDKGQGSLLLTTTQRLGDKGYLRRASGPVDWRTDTGGYRFGDLHVDRLSRYSDSRNNLKKRSGLAGPLY